MHKLFFDFDKELKSSLKDKKETFRKELINYINSIFTDKLNDKKLLKDKDFKKEINLLTDYQTHNRELYNFLGIEKYITLTVINPEVGFPKLHDPKIRQTFYVAFNYYKDKILTYFKVPQNIIVHDPLALQNIEANVQQFSDFDKFSVNCKSLLNCIG